MNSLKGTCLSITSKCKEAFKSPKKRAAIISALISIILLVAITFAWFISQTNLLGSKFQTGTVDFSAKGYNDNGEFVTTILQPEKSPEGVPNPNAPLFDKTNWQVGSVNTSFICIEKTGSLDMEYNLSLSATGDIEYLGGFWYNIKEITTEISTINGTDEEKIQAYAGSNKAIGHSETNCPNSAHTCTEKANSTYNMSTIDRVATRGELTANNVTKRYYRLDYGMKSNAMAVEYTNKTIQVATKIYASQIGALDNPDGKGYVYNVSGQAELDKALDNSLPGDVIKLSNNIIYEGDLIFSKPTNLLLNGKELEVRGNLIYNYVAPNNLKIDVTGSGKIKVVYAGTNIGGKFTINTPNSQVEIIGENGLGDIFVADRMTVNATKAVGTGGIIFTNAKVLDSTTNQPKTIYVGSDTRITVNSGVKIGKIEAVSRANNIEIQNAGTIGEIHLANMNLLPQTKSPQIYIHNTYKIEKTIVLPTWSEKFVITNPEPLTCQGNTKVVKGFGASEMTVTGPIGSNHFTNSDIENENVGDKIAEWIDGTDKKGIKVYFRDLEEKPNTSLNDLLQKFLTDEGMIPADVFRELTTLEIVTIGNKTVVNTDIAFMKGLVKLANLNLARATLYDDNTNKANRLCANAFYSKDSLKSVVLPNELTEIGLSALYQTGITNITIPASVSLMEATCIYTQKVPILYINFEGYTPVSTFTKDNVAAWATMRIFVPEEVLETYRQAYSAFSDRIYPKAVLSDNNDTFVRRLADGKYEIVYYSGAENTSLSVGSNLSIGGEPIAVSSVGDHAYRWSLTNGKVAIRFANTVKTIGQYSFYGTSVNTIDFNNVEYLGLLSFSKCNQLYEVNTGKVAKIAPGAFQSCENLVKANVPNAVILENRAVHYEGAFSKCINLISVDFGKITKFGSYMFSDNPKLREIFIRSTDVDEMNFYYTSEGQPNFSGWLNSLKNASNLRIYTNSDVLEAIRAKDVANNNSYYFSIGEKVGKNIVQHLVGGEVVGEVNLGQYVVRDIAGGTELVCYNGIETIMGNFKTPTTTKDIDSAVITAKSITSIGPYAYANNNFSDINLSFGDYVKRLEKYCFTAKKIININFSNVTYIGKGVFYNCDLIKELNTAKVKTIGTDAFKSCDQLYKGVFPEVLEFQSESKDWAGTFQDCKSLISLDFYKAIKFTPRMFHSSPKLREIIVRSRDTDNMVFSNLMDGVTNAVGWFGDNALKVNVFVYSDVLEEIRNKAYFGVTTRIKEIGEKFGEHIITTDFGDSMDIGEYVIREVDGEVSISSYNKMSSEVTGDYVIPDQINGKPVTKLGPCAYTSFPFDTSNFTFNESLKEIGDYTFYETKIKGNVDLKNVMKVGKYSFFNCDSILSLNAPKLEEILIYAFCSCNNIVSMTINAHKIEKCALEAMTSAREIINLTDKPAGEITLGVSWGVNTLKVSGGKAKFFIKGENLSETPMAWASISTGVYEIGEKVGTYNITTTAGTYNIGEYIVTDSGKISSYNEEKTIGDSYEVPVTLGEKAITAIGRNAYRYVNFNITNITIPYAIKTVDDSAFYGAKIKSVVAEGLLSIDTLSFAYSKYLMTFYAPELVSIGANGFVQSSNLYSLVTNANTMGQDAIAYCYNLRELWLATSGKIDLFSLANSMVWAQNITRLRIYTNESNIKVIKALNSVSGTRVYDKNVTRIGSEPIEVSYQNEVIGTVDFGTHMVQEIDGGIKVVSCNLTDTLTGTEQAPFEIISSFEGKDVIEIGDGAFVAASFDNAVIKIPSTVKKIGISAFYTRKITGMLNLMNVTEVATNAFRATNITKLIAPEVLSLGDYVFAENALLISARFPKLKTMGGYTFLYDVALADVYFGALEKSEVATLLGCTSIKNVFIDKICNSKNDLPVCPNWNTTNNGGIVRVPRVSRPYYGDTWQGLPVEVYDKTVNDSDNLYSVVDSNGGYEIIYVQTAVENIVIPSSLDGKNIVSISDYAFSAANTKNITLPQYFKYYYDNNFTLSSAIQNIFVDVNNPYFKDVNGVLFTKDGKELVCYPKNRTDSYYQAPNGTVMLKSYAFNGAKSLNRLVLPSSFAVSGSDVFNGCSSLKEVLMLSATPPMVTTTQMFKGAMSSLEVFVPAESVEPYKNKVDLFNYETAIKATDHFNINYNAGEGIAVDSTYSRNGQRAVKPLDPVKDGYIFSGWFKDEACTSEWNFDSDIVNSVVTLFAKWVQAPIVTKELAETSTASSQADSQQKTPEQPVSQLPPPVNQAPIPTQGDSPTPPTPVPPTTGGGKDNDDEENAAAQS